MEACPLFIEHVPKIVDLRRHLSMEASIVPDGISGAMLSIEQRGHPWTGTRFSRMDWCRDLDIRVLKPEEVTDTLLWVGCTAAMDARAQKVARSLVRLLRTAKIDFAILGDDEKCTGDVARRTGNDYLFQVMAGANVETLNARSFSQIVSICPHCVNTLKNEYPSLGGKYSVLHHTQLLAELMKKGLLPHLNSSEERTVTYHDPCYLGRYNDEFDAPRTLIAGTGATVVEMKRSARQSFCCGGGGGRSFAIEPPEQRVNVIRAKQAQETSAPLVATACPFCLLMLEDGCKTVARQGEDKSAQQVRDIAEILDDAIHGGATEVTA